MNVYDLNERVAVVTGGAQGIARRWCALFDLDILLHTPFALLKTENAY